MTNDPGFWDAQDAAETAFRARPDHDPALTDEQNADYDRLQEWRDEDREWRDDHLESAYDENNGDI
jgi:hypothetical protein